MDASMMKIAGKARLRRFRKSAIDQGRVWPAFQPLIQKI